MMFTIPQKMENIELKRIIPCETYCSKGCAREDIFVEGVFYTYTYTFIFYDYFYDIL
jgi:hypothetical protein